jgi:hypothetical protein
MASPAIPSPAFDSDQHNHRWVVDLRTRRIARSRCVMCEAAVAGADAERKREAVMDVVKEIREAMEEAAEAIEPSKADLRLVTVEDEGEHVPPPAGKASHARTKAPAAPEVHPSPKELGKEHRGY